MGEEKKSSNKTNFSSEMCDGDRNDGDFLKLKQDDAEQAGPQTLATAEVKAQLQKDLERKSARTNRPQSKKDLARAMNRHGIKSKHTKFDDAESSSSSDDRDDEEGNKLDLEKARARLNIADKANKEAQRLRVRERKTQQKLKEKLALQAAFSSRRRDMEPEVRLGGGSDLSESDAGDDDQSESEDASIYQSNDVPGDSDQSDDDGDSPAMNRSAEGSSSEEKELEMSGESELGESEEEPPAKRNKSKRSVLSAILGASDSGVDQRLDDNTLDEDEQFALRLLQSGLE